MPTPTPRAPKRPGLRVISRPGSNALYLRGVINGRRIFESTGTDSPQLAEEARAQREAELYRAGIYGAQPKVTFAAAVVSYSQAEARPASTLAYLNRILPVLGQSVACQDVNQAVIDRACRVLCRPGAKPGTKLRNVVTPIRAVLMHAVRRGWCTPPVFERQRSSPARTAWLTPAQAEAMITAAVKRQAHLRPLLMFLFCTGARLGEAIALDWQDVDLQGARAVLRETKNGRDRLVDLPPRAVVELANLPQRDGPVFRARGRGYRRTQTSRTVPYGGQARRAFASCLKAAGITSGLTPHHVRHSWATWHYGVHRDLLRLKADGAWSSVSQVERYAKLMPAHLAPDALRFWGLGGAVEKVSPAVKVA
jgi:integrase